MAEPVQPDTPTPGWSTDQLKQHVDEKIAGLERAVDVAREGVPPHVTIQVYFEMLLNEREKQIQTIFEEQRRAMTVAEEEREKSARALRTELGRAIEEGDRALRDHIAAQVSQIQSSLSSAERLELTRIESERRVVELTRELSDQAIQKAETASQKQFSSLEARLDALRDMLLGVSQRLDKLT